MLEKLKGLLESKPSAKKTGGGSTWNPNFVTDPVRIVSLLNDMVHQRTALYLQIEESALENPENDTEGMIVSYLYKLGTERAALSVAESPEHDAKLREARKFKVIGDIHQSVLTFRAEVLDIQEEEGREYYIIKLPDRVYHPKREKTRRVKLDKHHTIPVYLRFFEPPKTFPGVTDDLSPRSMSVLLSADEQTLPYVRKGDELKSCSFGVGNRQFQFDARVSQVRRVNDKLVRIDCAFTSPSPELEDAIQGLLKGV